jgi:hypothetical protein
VTNVDRRPPNASDQEWSLFIAHARQFFDPGVLETWPITTLSDQFQSWRARRLLAERRRSEEPARLRLEAEARAALDKRAAQVAPFKDPELLCDLVLALEARVAKAEAEGVEMRVRIAQLETAQPGKTKVGRIFSKTAKTPPEAA